MLGMEGMLTGESASLLVSMKSAKYTRSSRKSARRSLRGVVTSPESPLAEKATERRPPPEQSHSGNPYSGVRGVALIYALDARCTSLKGDWRA